MSRGPDSSPRTNPAQVPKVYQAPKHRQSPQTPQTSPKTPPTTQSQSQKNGIGQPDPGTQERPSDSKKSANSGDIPGIGLRISPFSQSKPEILDPDIPRGNSPPCLYQSTLVTKMFQAHSSRDTRKPARSKPAQKPAPKER